MPETNHQQPDLQRRHFLGQSAFGLSGVALAWLQSQSPAAAEPRKPDLQPKRFDATPKETHHQPRAQAVISLFMQGGPSHIDLFDPKPGLQRLDGKAFPGKIKYDNAAQASSKVLPSPWKFRHCGESGLELSELLPHLGGVADDLTVIRSMHTGVNNHGQSIRAMQTGRTVAGRPTLGSWITYALGTENQSLPAFMALIDPGQLPVLGVENWSQGFLPALYQGTVVRPREPRIMNLSAPARLAGAAQKRYLAFLSRLNRRHLEKHPEAHDLAARIASYDLAARMQTAAAEALDLNQETEETQRLYGMDNPTTRDYGARCLIARRLVERGVRFVQVYTQNQFWDHHGRIFKSLPAACQKVDQPAAALVRDLKRRGLLDSTAVHFGGEMGRLPVIQNDTGQSNVGRDHNTYGFSMWVAGGGFRGGLAYGSTDEFGHKAVENVVNHYDYHATLFHLLGMDAGKVLFERNQSNLNILDGQPGRIIRDILA